MPDAPQGWYISSTFMRPAVYDASTGSGEHMEPLNIKISVRNLPSAYTCDGEDKSPEIDVGGVNVEHSKCLAIICNDPDAPGGGGFIHWLAWNIELVKLIPEKIPKDPVITFPVQAVQGTNSFGKSGILVHARPTARRTGISSRFTGWMPNSILHPVQQKRSFYEPWAGMSSSTARPT